MKPSFVIVGLGNIGEEYCDTRHNVGFCAVETLANDYASEDWKEKKKFEAIVCEGTISDVPVIFAKPTTYMNNSGIAVQKIIDFYDLDPANQLLVICDDIDLPVGEMRYKFDGGSGSHNGLKSLERIFGPDYARLRIGVRGEHAPEGSFRAAGENLANYVLSTPSKEDCEGIQSTFPQLKKQLLDIILKE